ncbi:MAG: MBL fold metallo-hydrolase [Candidatus Bathyarchaeales archaeon]
MVRNKTSLTFYGGVNEIGGNKILLQDGDTRVFLDFGLSFGKRGIYYDEFLSPRSACGLGDFIEMGLLPKIDGIYREDLLAMCGMKKQKPKIDAVFLTHAHADHANYISFLHEEIPIYLGETSLLMLNAVAESGTRSMEYEIIDFKRRPIGSKNEEPVRRTFKPFRTGAKIKIDTLEIEPVHVDHSVPGAYGFIIHTRKGAVVYTGDLRLHGTKPKMTREFVKHAEASEPAALIVEGTRIDVKHEPSSESKVKKECNSVVAKTDKFVVADFNFKDVDRLRTFFEIARANGRKLVVSLRDAFMLKWLSRDPKLNVPSYSDMDIVIHIPKRGTGMYRESDYNVNERQFLNLNNSWTAEKIRKNQRHLVSVLSFYNFNELIDIKPEHGSLFIHSLSEPFNEEMQVDFKRLMNWLRHFKLKMFQSHCSGHACGEELIGLARQIKPKTIFPVHTEHPRLFCRKLRGVRLVKEVVEYEL